MTHTVIEAPQYKWRHKGNPKRLYIVQVGEMVYYGSVLTHIRDHINSVTDLKLSLPGLYDSISLNIRKNPVYKGTRTRLIKDARDIDWYILQIKPNSVHIK